jgi:predicted transcriptional regulator
MIVTGSVLKKLRVDTGLTQRQLSRLAGLSQAHIAKIEGGNVDPRLSTVNKILQVLTQGEGEKCHEVMTKRVIFASPYDRILTASRLMMENAISQLPVTEGGRVIGTITEESIVRNLSSTIADEAVQNIMQAPLPSVPQDTDISMIRPLLENHSGVLIMEKGEIIGIITRSDLLKLISQTI